MVVFQKNDIRISLVLPNVLRVEKGVWTDLPTQIIQHRDHDVGTYTLTEENAEPSVLTLSLLKPTILPSVIAFLKTIPVPDKKSDKPLRFIWTATTSH